MPSKDEKCKKKNAGFSAFHLENEIKKDVDSCRAASQSIPLFSMTSDAKKLKRHPLKSGAKLDTPEGPSLVKWWGGLPMV